MCRVRMFMWRVVGDFLPTAAWLACRGLLQNSNCQLGCAANESLQHVFWDCQRAQELWADCQARGALAVLGRSTGAGAGLQSLDRLLRFVGSPIARRGNGARYLATLATTMYYIWARRNAMRHNNPMAMPCSLLRTIKIEVITVIRQHYFYSSLSSENPCNSSDLLVTHGWIPPPTGWIKVNCDAAVGDCIAGLGLVVKDCIGRSLLVAGKRVFSQATDMMEVQAMLKALNMLRVSFPFTGSWRFRLTR
ncbi:hypothetical protein HPP92_004458 [Vanilla planifolia]|uniref:Reverse transcriptase zinc-binding domain-containing protein n=1 Tax=Vanilla planifolia TaxID=51239 RepID=A0A835VAE5_VANPL|nr:hypothetical protein HPP92_004458 [Vanilla planifolia]